jgi:predicted enzyme related to lactoylglutathione lyase
VDVDHTIVHFEIPAEDPERAAAFYRKLFGWEINKWQGKGPDDPSAAMEYWMVSTVPTDERGMPVRPGINGGILRRKHPQQPSANYVGVESVETFARQAEALGAQVVVPKTPVPGMGWFLYLKDTEGNIFALWETDRNAA